MKKAAALILVVIIIAGLFCGCASQSGTVSSGTSKAGTFAKSDLYLTIDGTKYVCDGYIDDVISAFGEDYEYSEGMSCAYDGMDKVFTYPELDVYTRPDGDRDIVTEFCAYGTDVTSSKGIAVGSNGDAVREAYGEPTSATSRLLRYEIAPASAESEGASLYFKLDSEGVVTAIGITGEVLIGE